MTIHVVPVVGPTVEPAPFPNLDDAFGRILTAHRGWEQDCTRVWTDNAVLNALIRQSLHDLRLTTNQTETGLLPVAGIPWFAVPFPSLRPYLLRVSPVAFKRRNIFIDSTVGDRV